ncbi:MAG: hypothetical protein HYU86_05190 [Chloroflexi bacterium]|nr:hypothetical protein [Chloroflexota bacterium]
MEALINTNQLKELLKAALVEVLEEQRDLIHDIVEEAMEDVALARAIEAGKSTENVSRDEVFKLLQG